MTTKSSLSQVGFTLIESMLVTFILGILAIIGIAYYQNAVEELKVTKTVNQIQLWQQAANSFYIKNGCWPTSPGCVPDFSPYIPLGIATNPWNGAYSYVVSPEGKKFAIITTQIPQKMAARIAGRLPSSGLQCISQNCAIRSEISLPAQQVSQVPSFLTTNIGTISVPADAMSYSTSIPSFTCPQGWVGGTTVMLNSLYANPAPSQHRFCLRWQRLFISIVNATPNCSQTNNIFSCSINVSNIAKSVGGLCASFDDAYGSLTFSYISYCTSQDGMVNSVKPF